MMIDKDGKSDLFSDCVRDIEAEYTRLKHSLGWRFLYVSKTVLDNPVKLALLTMNPSGDEIPKDHPQESCENGVAYIVEKWNGRPAGAENLQKQVKLLFKMIRDTMEYEGSYSDLMAESLLSHFVPFRSPRFDDLPRKVESLTFGRHLWSRLLPIFAPRLIICLGREIQSELRDLIPEALSVTKYDTKTMPTHWGDTTADLDYYSGHDSDLRLLFLPHLSSFKLFKGKKSLLSG